MVDYLQAVFASALAHVTPRSCSSALSPRDDKLFVVNQDDGLDVYTIGASTIAHEASSSVSSGVGDVGVFVPILCVHGGAGILVGGMLGVVRILSAASQARYGAVLQTYRAENGNNTCRLPVAELLD